MNLSRLTTHLRKLSGYLRQSSRGAVAIEAALVIPIMIVLMLAMLEMYQYFRVVSVVDRAAFTVANGLAMQEDLSDGIDPTCTSPTDLCTYGKLMPQLLHPLRYSGAGKLQMRLFQNSGLDPNDDDWHYVWGRECGASAPDNCTVLTDQLPPSGLPAPAGRDSIIVVNVAQQYTPFLLSSRFWQSLNKGPVTLGSRAVIRPRFGDLLTLNVND